LAGSKVTKAISYVLAFFILLTGILTLFGPNLYFSRNKNVRYADDPRFLAYAEIVLGKIRTKEYYSLREEFERGIPDLEEGFSKTGDFFMQNNLDKEELVNYNVQMWAEPGVKTEAPPARLVTFLYDTEFSGQKGLILIRMKEGSEGLRLTALTFTPLEKSYRETVRENIALFSGPRLFSTCMIVIFTLLLCWSEIEYGRKAGNPRIWVQFLMPVSVGFAVFREHGRFVLDSHLISLLPIVNRGFNILGECTYGISLPLILLLYWVYFRRKDLGN